LVKRPDSYYNILKNGYNIKGQNTSEENILGSVGLVWVRPSGRTIKKGGDDASPETTLNYSSILNQPISN